MLESIAFRIDELRVDVWKLEEDVEGMSADQDRRSTMTSVYIEPSRNASFQGARNPSAWGSLTDSPTAAYMQYKNGQEVARMCHVRDHGYVQAP